MSDTLRVGAKFIHDDFALYVTVIDQDPYYRNIWTVKVYVTRERYLGVCGEFRCVGEPTKAHVRQYIAHHLPGLLSTNTVLKDTISAQE